MGLEKLTLSHGHQSSGASDSLWPALGSPWVGQAGRGMSEIKHPCPLFFSQAGHCGERS